VLLEDSGDDEQDDDDQGDYDQDEHDYSNDDDDDDDEDYDGDTPPAPRVCSSIPTIRAPPPSYGHYHAHQPHPGLTRSLRLLIADSSLSEDGAVGEDTILMQTRRAIADASREGGSQ
jgi:hypothetical protein